MQIPNSIWTLIIGIVVTLVSLWYGQNHGLLPTAASNEAVLIDGLFNTMLTISTVLFLIVEGALIYSAIRFRQRPGDDTDGPPVFGNIPSEILWTAIPTIVVLGIAIYSFDVYTDMGGFDPHGMHDHPVNQQAVKIPGAAIAATLNDTPPSTEPNVNQQKQEEALQDPATASVRSNIPQRRDAPGVGVVSPGIGASPDNEGKAPGFVVNVTGMQYAWIFTYPETGVTSGELHVPVGREVQVNISANDVIHAFWVPEFRLKQDAIPGRQSEIRFTPDRAGEYPLICAELCGPYHGAMKTQVIVESQQAVDQWLQEQQVATTEVSPELQVALNAADSNNTGTQRPTSEHNHTHH